VVVTVISFKSDEETKSKLLERAHAEGKSLSQIVGHIVTSYLNKTQSDTSPSPSQSNPARICPLCDAPLIYIHANAVHPDGLKCSNPLCDTHYERKYSLKRLLGEWNHARLLNILRREVYEREQREKTGA